MAAYMKYRSPFYGVGAPLVRPIISRIVKEYGRGRSRDEFEALIAALWNEPEREPKYLALGVARRLKEHHVPESLPFFERLIVEGDWWDLVDAAATHLVGSAIRQHSVEVWPVVDAWVESPNLWLRRTTLICQLGRKDETDAARLFDACRRLAHETEFFIRKAIGWGLREYARTDPEAVRGFVLAHTEQLSELSIREATKHIGLD